MKKNVSPVPDRIWNKSFILLVLTVTLIGITNQMVTPLISLYAVNIGAPITVAATIASLWTLSAVACRPVSGALADIVNRKKLLMAAGFATALSVGLYDVADNVTALIVIRILHGFSFSFTSVAYMTFAVMFLPESKLGEGIGYLTLGTIIAQAVGPAAGLWLAEYISYRVCFLTASVFSLLSMAVLFFAPYNAPEKNKNTQTKFEISFDMLFAKELFIYAAIIGLVSCGNGLVAAFLALLGAERGIAHIGLFFTAYSIVLIAIRPFTGRLLDRKGLAVILFPAILAFAAGNIVLGDAQSLGMVIISAVLRAIGQGSATPAIQAYSVKKLGKERAGVATSTCLVGQDIGYGIAPLIGGFVVESFGYTQLFYGYAVLLFAAGLGLYAIQLGIEKRKRIS